MAKPSKRDESDDKGFEKHTIPRSAKVEAQYLPKEIKKRKLVTRDVVIFLYLST